MANTKTPRETFEIEAEVVFSHIVTPYKKNRDDESGSYNMTVRIAKSDKKQLNIIADAAKKVLNLEKVSPTLMGLTDGATIKNKYGEPVDPDGYQLMAFGRRSDRGPKPTVVNIYGQKVYLPWEPGTNSSGERSVVALALSASPRTRTIDNGLVKNEVDAAGYFIRKIMLIDAHPYDYDDDYTFERFGNSKQNETPENQETSQQTAVDRVPDVSDEWQGTTDDEPQF